MSRVVRVVVGAMVVGSLASCALPANLRGVVGDVIDKPLVATNELPACVGAEVVRWVDEPVGCDLTPPQVLTLLGSTEVDCADMGGSWIYEACVGVDY